MDGASRILVTGGSGFIGANFLTRYVPLNPSVQFLNLDKLSYASHPLNLSSIESLPNYSFARIDLVDEAATRSAVSAFAPDLVIHFAAESHVDRSILSPKAFLESNVMGTFHLLEACRSLWTGGQDGRFHHVSTDEVYGSLGDTGLFTETTAYDPSSPYSASKAASDHIVRAYHRTYGMPITITNCSNNYGPRQFPEKLIPLMILNCLARKPLPVYGQGTNVRDWLHVDDHCEAIWTVAHRGVVGATYNVGGNSEQKNIDVVKTVIAQVALATGVAASKLEGLIQYVTDRPGHDFRYAIDASKIQSELGWTPKHTFAQGIAETVAWYLENPEWVRLVQTGEYKTWLEAQYGAAK